MVRSIEKKIIFDTIFFIFLTSFSIDKRLITIFLFLLVELGFVNYVYTIFLKN